jgi:hypothetical protein
LHANFAKRLGVYIDNENWQILRHLVSKTRTSYSEDELQLPYGLNHCIAHQGDQNACVGSPIWTLDKRVLVIENVHAHENLRV